MARPKSHIMKCVAKTASVEVFRLAYNDYHLNSLKAPWFTPKESSSCIKSWFLSIWKYIISQISRTEKKVSIN